MVTVIIGAFIQVNKSSEVYISGADRLVNRNTVYRFCPIRLVKAKRIDAQANF